MILDLGEGVWGEFGGEGSEVEAEVGGEVEGLEGPVEALGLAVAVGAVPFESGLAGAGGVARGDVAGGAVEGLFPAGVEALGAGVDGVAEGAPGGVLGVGGVAGGVDGAGGVVADGVALAVGVVGGAGAGELAVADAGGEGLGEDAQGAGGGVAREAVWGEGDRGAVAGDGVGGEKDGAGGVVVGEASVVGAEAQGEGAEAPAPAPGSVSGRCARAGEAGVEAGGEGGAACGGVEAGQDVGVPGAEEGGVEGVHDGRIAFCLEDGRAVNRPPPGGLFVEFGAVGVAFVVEDGAAAVLHRLNAAGSSADVTVGRFVCGGVGGIRGGVGGG